MTVSFTFDVPIDKRVPGQEVLITNEFRVIDSFAQVRTIEIPRATSIPDTANLDVWVNNPNPTGTQLTEVTQAHGVTSSTEFFVERTHQFHQLLRHKCPAGRSTRHGQAVNLGSARSVVETGGKSK